MKKIVYGILLVCIMLSISSSITYSFYLFLYKHHPIALHFDSLFSDQACKEISSWLQESHRPCSIHSLMSDVEKQFGCIRSVRYLWKPSGIYDIFISAHSPRILYGTTLVITDHTDVVSQTYFASSYLEKLPAIKCKTDVSIDITDQARTVFIAMPPVVFQKYFITWYDQTRIWLHSKQQSHHIILADSLSVVDTVKIEKAFGLYKSKIKQNKKIDHKKLMYDIRFNNQILEYVMKGKWGDAKQNVI